jgi:predicted protein tyrosine phosphatase
MSTYLMDIFSKIPKNTPIQRGLQKAQKFHILTIMSNIHRTQINLTNSIPDVLNIMEAQERCHQYDVVITAGPTKREVADFGHPNHKVVSFQDITNGRGAPTIRDVAELIEFGAGMDNVLVHCHAGISRSTATAWGISIANGVDPRVALEKLDANQPWENDDFSDQFSRRWFSPNRLIVQHLQTYFSNDNLLDILYSTVKDLD